MYQNILCERYYHKILEKAKEIYDFIIIDTSGFITVSSTAFSIKNATSVFCITEGDYISLRTTVRLLDHIHKYWEIDKYDVKIIINKYDSYSIDKDIIAEILEDYTIVAYFDYDNRHIFFKNKRYPMLQAHNKQDEDCYLKILEKFNYVKKESFFEKLKALKHAYSYKKSVAS
jgi:cellulose biosynthesis protein BcsQ